MQISERHDSPGGCLRAGTQFHSLIIFSSPPPGRPPGPGPLDQFSARLSDLADRKTDAQLTRAMARALRRVKDAQGVDMIDLTEEELAELETNPEALQKYLVEDGAADDAAAASNKGGEGEGRGRGPVGAAHRGAGAEARRGHRGRVEAGAGGAGGRRPNGGRRGVPTSIEMIEGGPAGLERAETASAPELGKIPGVAGGYNRAADPDDAGQDELGEYREIKRVTGLTTRSSRGPVGRLLSDSSASDR
ncbi:hypothetical protein V2A60_008724 [Cordyceps javanica]